MIKVNTIIKFDRRKREQLFYALSLVIRLVLGCLFIWGSLSKIRQPYDFLANVYEYELVGPRLGMVTAMTLPWLELLVGICLIGGIFVGGALLTSAGMATMFVFVLSSVLYRGLEISCGCFGSDADLITHYTVIRAFLILLFSIGAYICVIVHKSSSEMQKIK